MIRLALLWVVVVFLSLYAWRDWYRSLCGLVLLLAITEHPDMPKTIFSIQGLNPWNLLLLVILLAWLVARKREGLKWDMPRAINLLLLFYLGVVSIGFVRMMSDRNGLEDYTVGYLTSEYLINNVKWVLPGALLFDGCRSRQRFLVGLASVLLLYILLGLQVVKWMPPDVAFSGEALSARSLKILVNEVGYHRVNLSMMLAGASWAIFATVPLAKQRFQLGLIIAATLVVVYAQALTGGRAGYVAWAVVGLSLCVIRWRRYLPLVPILILLAALLVPGAAHRMLQGFSLDTRDSTSLVSVRVGQGVYVTDDGPDVYTITAGRNVAWPYVIDKIAESPIFGFGRQAMLRTGVANFLWDEFKEQFSHPHNAYLELLLDNGWVGFLLIIPFYFVVLAHAIALFRDRSPLAAAIGGVACSLIISLLVASAGSQTFYPREGSVGMWCAIGLMLRTSVQRRYAASGSLDEQPITLWWQPSRSHSDIRRSHPGVHA